MTQNKYATCCRRWFHIKSGVEVKWMMHESSALYHATIDGKISVCGCSNLIDIKHFLIDPSNDLMTCLNCQDLVRRGKNAYA